MYNVVDGQSVQFSFKWAIPLVASFVVFLDGACTEPPFPLPPLRGAPMSTAVDYRTPPLAIELVRLVRQP